MYILDPPLSWNQTPSLPRPYQLRSAFSKKPSSLFSGHVPSPTLLLPPSILYHDMLTLPADMYPLLAWKNAQHAWAVGWDGRPIRNYQSEQGGKGEIYTQPGPWPRVWSVQRQLQARPGHSAPRSYVLAFCPEPGCQRG